MYRQLGNEVEGPAEIEGSWRMGLEEEHQLGVLHMAAEEG